MLFLHDPRITPYLNDDVRDIESTQSPWSLFLVPGSNPSLRNPSSLL